MFSIIIPTYNRPRLLKEAIRSALDQTVNDFEVIVVNDGGLVVDLPEDRRLRLLEQENRGSAAARNHGLREAAGEYVCFLDDDDLLTPDRLEIAFEGLAHSPLTICNKSYGRTASDDLRLFMRGSGTHIGQYAMVRDRCLPLDERFRSSEDLEWAIRSMDEMDPYPVNRVGYIMRDYEGRRLTANLEQMYHDRVMLFETHPEYFRSHRDALAYQWKILGAQAAGLGQTARARQAFIRSFRVAPSPRTAYHFLKTLS